LIFENHFPIIIVMRQKVKTFFHVFKQSIFPQPDYYSKIPKVSFTFSFKYFSSLIISLNLILLIFVSVKYNPGKINRFINSIIISFKEYPNELIINLRKGSLFSSYNRPYLFWGELAGKRKLYLVVDESASADKILQYHSQVLLTKKELVVNNQTSNVKYQTIPLTYFGDKTFDKKDSERLISLLTITKSLLIVIYLVVVPSLMLILPFSSFIITLFYLSIISFFIYVVFKTYFHKRIHYKKIFQVGLHAVTLPLLLDYILIIFKPSIPANFYFKPFIPSPIAFVILVAVFVFAAVYEAYESKQQNKNHHPTHHKHSI